MINGFTGVELRLDPTTLGNGKLVRGLNIDIYETLGVIKRRRVFSTLYSDLNVPQRSIAVMPRGSVIHAGSTTLYDNGLSVGTSLNPNYPVDMVVYKGVNSPEAEVFIANGRVAAGTGDSSMFRYTQTTLGKWGIDAPIAAPFASAGAGSLTGNYSAKYTYVRKSGSITVHQSNPSPATNTVALSGGGLSFPVIASTDPSVTHIRIYRTAAGGATYLLDKEVPNESDTVLSVKVDGGLGAAVDTDNDRPMPATILHVMRDRIWSNDIGVPNRLRFTSRFLPESQPSSNYIDIGSREEKITGITSIDNTVIAFTSTTKYRIIEADANVTAVGGNLPIVGGATADFIVFELPSSRGCKSKDAIISSGYGIIYPSKDGIFVSNASGAEQKVSDSVQPIFFGVKTNGIPPINFDHEENIVCALHRNRLYMSYTSVESEDENNDYTLVMDMDTTSAYFWDVGFTSLLFDDGEDSFFAGDNVDRLLQIERTRIGQDYGSTDISCTIETPSMYATDAVTRSVFFYFRVDAMVHDDDSLTASFYADGTLRKVATITGDRTRELIRLPAQSKGYTWKVIFDYSGANLLEIHGVECRYMNLEGS
jgi:hypothetical protein